jgi:hypothetical protein
LQEAVLAQQQIGWGNFIKGRLSKLWRQAYVSAREVIVPLNQRLPTGDTWGRDVITILWKYILDTWYCRNSMEHKKDQENIPKTKE